MLREYTSIPQSRLACQIEETGKVEKVREGVAKYENKVGSVTELMEFTYSDGQKPEAGDYIVHLSKTDIYLVKKDVFEKSYRSTGFKLK